MTPERWQHVRRVLSAALELEPDARPAYLDRACAGHPSLRREVEALLASEDDVRSSFLQSPPVVGSLDPTALRGPDWPAPLQGHLVGAKNRLEAGKVFGPYLLIGLLGEGGFGQVWEAESLDNRRRVALKVLTKVAADDPHALRRFEREGQLAASLNHPSCVFVFGAQQIEGYPTIAMELMPGGTLQDRLNREGKLPVKQAVDFTLQIIDGLEAAHQAGIVHRDVKPSNCFLDHEGHAKIGDFGVSKTFQAERDLSAPGYFLGMPSYASPEQAKGREVDFRSDIYSVGASLYALLTGKPPFVGSHAGEVLARIAAEKPAPFSEHHVRVPKALQRIVLRRALAKDKRERYQDYASFREALIPFSSDGLTPATLRRRLGAIFLDKLLFFSLSIMARNALIRVQPGLVLLLAFAAEFLYFAVTEKLWGQSLGKFVFRLRVTATAGSAMTVGQACLRTVVFLLFCLAPGLVGSGLLRLPVLIGGLALAGDGALLSTMRRRNGYAGLHEVLSNTRVRQVREMEPVFMLAPEPGNTTPAAASVTRILDLRTEPKHMDTAPEPQPSRRFGPYAVIGTVWEMENEALFLAYDDVLRRRVWVHKFRDASQAPAMSGLATLRTGRLQWLLGSRTVGGGWDAYEAPPGTSFLSWVRAKGRLSWHEISWVLSGVLGEISARLSEADSPRQLSLGHIWVGPPRRAKVLDFPAAIEHSAGDGLVALEDWRQLIHQMVLFGLEGESLMLANLGSRLPRVPLPEYVRPLMNSICQAGPASQSPDKLLAEVQSVSARPARVTARKRLGSILLANVVVLFPLLAFLLFSRSLSTMPDWVRDLMRIEQYRQFLGFWESSERNFAGTWLENNPRNPAYAVKMEIRQVGPRVKVHMWKGQYEAGITSGVVRQGTVTVPGGKGTCPAALRKPGFTYGNEILVGPQQCSLHGSSLTCQFMVKSLAPCGDVSVGTNTFTQVFRRVDGRPPEEESEVQGTPDRQESQKKAEAIRKVLAASYRMAKSSSQGREFLSRLVKQDKELLESALKEYPATTPEEISEARKLLNTDADFKRVTTILENPLAVVPPGDLAVGIIIVMAFFVVIPGILAALIFRGAPALYLSGIAIQNAEGGRAGRLRCFLRALVALSPFLLATLLIWNKGDSAGAIANRLLPILVPVAVLGAVYAVASPERGIQDVIAGTHLVPR